MNSGIDSSVIEAISLNVLRHGIERGRRHIDRHEDDGDGAERKRNRHAGKHRKQGGKTVTEANSENAHRRDLSTKAVLPTKGIMICSSSCRHNKLIPSAIST